MASKRFGGFMGVKRVAALGIIALGVLLPNCANAQVATSTNITPNQQQQIEAVRTALRTVESLVQARIIDVRDQVQSLVARMNSAPRLRATPFAAEGAVDPYAPGYDPFESTLGYARTGMVTKAPPKAAPEPPNYFIS